MDIYYETPRLPMFMFMEEDNLARVRVLRYRDGELDGVLADWDADNIQDSFYGKEYWNDEYEEPFYCMYRDKSEIRFRLENIDQWVKGAVSRTNGFYTYEDKYKQVMDNIEKVGCPIFDSIDDARKYVFQNNAIIQTK